MNNKQIHRYMLNDQFNFSVSHREINESYALHWHNYIELELITSGCGYQILHGQHIELSKGCLSLLRPNDFHQVEPGNNFQLLNMSIDDTLLPENMISKITAAQILFFRLKIAE